MHNKDEDAILHCILCYLGWQCPTTFFVVMLHRWNNGQKEFGEMTIAGDEFLGDGADALMFIKGDPIAEESQRRIRKFGLKIRGKIDGLVFS